MTFCRGFSAFFEQQVELLLQLFDMVTPAARPREQQLVPFFWQQLSSVLGILKIWICDARQGFVVT